MIRKVLHTAELQYVIDFYDANLDMNTETHYDEFIMLRKYDMVNNIAEDTDIYLIDRTTWNNYCEELYTIVWPASNTSKIEYSENYENFNVQYIIESLMEFDDYDNKVGNIGTDVYELLDNKGASIPIKCNKVRIYRPMNKIIRNNIVHIVNMINNIRFHYICKRYEDFEIHSNEQFSVNNTIYSEYIEVFFPNIPELFGEYSKVYYKEDMNLVYSSKNEEFMSEIKKYFYNNDGEETQLIPFNLFVQPYKLIDENGETVKQYLKLTKSLENNCFTFPITVILYPYLLLETYNNFVPNGEYPYNSCSFMAKYEIKLGARLDFCNNHISIVGEFNFPHMNQFYDDKKGSAIKKAYCYFNNVKESMYNNFSEKQKNLLFGDIDAMDIKSFTKYDKQQVMTKYNIRDVLSDEQLFDLYKQMKRNALEEEYLESQNSKIDFIGFKLIVATDWRMEKRIYERDATIDIKDLDNFAVDITGIYESWKQVNKSIIAQISFIDRFLGVELKSNLVYITNEYLKYSFLDHTSLGRLNVFAKRNDEFSEEINKDNVASMKELIFNDENTKFSFLNNITCVINTNNTSDQTNISSTSNNVRILYRPIFYRTNDLQNVRIRKNVVQKIGINLAQYMTKVESFKLVINNTLVLTEFGRNDVYVLFEVAGSKIRNNTGQYDIFNQDDEYIATGSYQLY